MAAAIGGPPSPFDSSVYYYHRYETETTNATDTTNAKSRSC
jgi:hypothetical protein